MVEGEVKATGPRVARMKTTGPRMAQSKGKGSHTVWERSVGQRMGKRRYDDEIDIEETVEVERWGGAGKGNTFHQKRHVER